MNAGWMSEPGYKLEYFGWGPTGDEQALLEAYPRLPKTVFLRAITRCRRLSAEGLKALWDSVANPDPRVRGLALGALDRLKVLAAPEHFPLLEAIETSGWGNGLTAKCILNRSRSLEGRSKLNSLRPWRGSGSRSTALSQRQRKKGVTH
jgi:hypothetical protein